MQRAYKRDRECLDSLIKISGGAGVEFLRLLCAYGESAVEWPIANTLIELLEREGLEPSTPAYELMIQLTRPAMMT